MLIHESINSSSHKNNAIPHVTTKRSQKGLFRPHEKSKSAKNEIPKYVYPSLNPLRGSCIHILYAKSTKIGVKHHKQEDQGQFFLLFRLCCPIKRLPTSHHDKESNNHFFYDRERNLLTAEKKIRKGNKKGAGRMDC